MPWTDALIQIPQFAQRPSGLIVPVVTDRPVVSGGGGRFADGNPIAGDAFFIMAPPPSELEQMRLVLDESGVGYSVSNADALIQMVSNLGFETGMLAISRLACHAWQMRGDTDAQLSLAPEIFGDRRLVDAIERLAQSEPGRLEVFPEQHAAVLQRLLVLYGRDARLGETKDGEQRIFNRAWLAAAFPSSQLDGDAPDPVEGRPHWIAYFLQNGIYNRSEDSLSSMIRPHILLGDIARSSALRDHPQFCEVDDWHRAAYGYGLSEQFALGIAIASKAGVFKDSVPIRERSVVNRAYFSDVVERLGGGLDQAKELIVADRDWYRVEFESHGDNLPTMAWDRVPFEARPLLELSGGELVATSPRAVESWLGDGIYHRTLAAARARDSVSRFQGFYGALVEEYVLQVLRHVHPESSPVAPCQVFGEQPYGRGNGKRSPDVAVACGPDLILIEVCSGRFTLRTVIEGSPDAALAEVERLVIGKSKQLGRRIADFRAGDWGLPGVDPNHVHRIWPIVVSADVMQNQLLWDEIRSQLGSDLRQPKVQPLTLLDLAELEHVAALVERGHGLVGLISAKAKGPYAELDFRRFVADTPGLPEEIRLSLLDDRWAVEMHGAAEAFGFDIGGPEAIKQRVAAATLGSTTGQQQARKQPQAD